MDGNSNYSNQVGVPDNWQGQRQWAAMKSTVGTAMAVGTDNNQLKGPAEKTSAAAMVTAAETATATLRAQVTGTIQPADTDNSASRTATRSTSPGCAWRLVVGHLDMYRTKILLYRTMVLLARPTKVRR